jgi:hypothetical protein
MRETPTCQTPTPAHPSLPYDHDPYPASDNNPGTSPAAGGRNVQHRRIFPLMPAAPAHSTHLDNGCSTSPADNSGDLQLRRNLLPKREVSELEGGITVREGLYMFGISRARTTR